MLILIEIHVDKDEKLEDWWIKLTNPEECFLFLFDLDDSTVDDDIVAFVFDVADVSPDEHPFCLNLSKKFQIYY